MVHYLAATANGVDRYAETEIDFLDVPLQEYLRLIEYADPDGVHPNALKDNAIRREQGYWVKPETLPKQMLWANGAKALPDVLPGFVVSPRFRALVEQFEPGVHQFVPIEVFKDRGGDPAATYYWFVVGQRLDSVDRESTTFVWEGGEPSRDEGYWVDSQMDTTTWVFTPIPNAKLVFSNSQVDGHHIWHDPHLLTFANGLCSDVFAEALSSSGMTGVAVTPRETA